jgi:hypothetical protein
MISFLGEGTPPLCSYTAKLATHSQIPHYYAVFCPTSDIYGRTLLRSFSRDQRIRDVLSGKTY